MKNLILVLSLIFIGENVWAGVWRLSARSEFVDPKDRVKKSVLKFSQKNGTEKNYAPPAYPWGFYESKEIILNGQGYFITFWTGGARSVYYRVFNPDLSEVPVCEFTTESEDPQLRYNEGQIQYLETVIHADNKKISVWKKCLPPPVVSQPSKGPASLALPKKSLKKNKKASAK